VLPAKSFFGSRAVSRLRSGALRTGFTAGVPFSEVGASSSYLLPPNLFTVLPAGAHRQFSVFLLTAKD
jgi:hypothetical protein